MTVSYPDDTAPGRVIAATARFELDPGAVLTLDDLVDLVEGARSAGVPGGAPVLSGRRAVRQLSAEGPWSGRLP